MRVALVHDWLTGMRGGEKVLLSLMELFPQADLFTLVHRPEKMDPAFLSRRIFTSTLQRWPWGPTRYPYYLPFYGYLTGGFDLADYDLIVSSSSACAKWVPNPRRVPHVCYCHSPMRYIWDLFDDYFGASAPLPLRLAARALRSGLQRRDLESNRGVTHFIANSTEVKGRIERTYGREAEVIHPPVDVGRFQARKDPGAEGYFLVISALVPYKRVDLAVRACARLDLPLVVVGTGPGEKKLRKLAGPRTRFKGWAADGEMQGLYDGARALLFPGKEDFGIVPVESLAAGCPVIALGEGGVRDTLQDGVTGPWFREQAVEALAGALERFQSSPPLDPEALRRRALPFSKERFLSEVRGFFTARPELKGAL